MAHCQLTTTLNQNKQKASHLAEKSDQKILMANIPYRETSLHVASAAGAYESARLLLTYGANPDEKNGNGETALHIACHYLQSDLISLLLDQAQ